MEKCKDLIPDYLRFVTGLVDSADLSLNISREMLQQDKQLKKIATSLEKKIISELEKLKEEDFEKYLQFYKEFGASIKYGVYSTTEEVRNNLKELLVYETINQEKKVTLKQYRESMLEGQDGIYYVVGKSKTSAMSIPQIDYIKSKGYDVLVLAEPIDEFALKALVTYDEKAIVNLSTQDFNLLNEEESKQIDELEKSNKNVLDEVKKVLGDKIDEVKFAKHLVDSPVALVSGKDFSFQMEQALSDSLQGGQSYKAKRILELNPKHKLYEALSNSLQDEVAFARITKVLYYQSLLVEGLKIDDPLEYNKLVNELISK
jgi:molecular chaperone HtpG